METQGRKKLTVFLWGMMGAGKSSLAKQLSSRLGWKYVDLDRVIELEFGASISEIFNREGESFFRSLERKALHSLADREETVIAVGGGTPCDDASRSRMLNTGLCVYLKAEPGLMANRLWLAKEKRPLLANLHSQREIEEKLSELLKEREIHYLKAHATIEVGKAKKTELVSKLAALVTEGIPLD